MKIRFCKQNYCDRDTIQPPELENVNGGIRVKSQGGVTDPRKKTFEIRVK